MPLKILLLQVRNENDPVKEEERQAFAAKAGLPVDDFVSHDLISGPPTLKKVRQFDALMVGGSGDYYVSKKNLPQLPHTLELLQETVACGHPIFASCFGFQLMVKALGGEIIFDGANTEVGTYQLSLTESGQKDELLGSLPVMFPAQLGRKDRAVRLPQNCLHLAFSERCPYQALRISSQPIWATQFHPEMSGKENRKRFLQYRAGYGAVLGQDEQQVLDRFYDSPQAETLIPRFLQLVFG